MASRVLVVGSGEVATACALSLLAGSASAQAVMLVRDAESLHDMQHGSRTFRVFDKRIPVPPRLSFRPMSAASAEPIDAALLCVPVAALSDDSVLQCVRRCAGVPLFVFTRGLTRDGRTPLEHLRAAMGPAPAEVPAKSAGGGLVAVSGPLFAKEWAAAAAAEPRGANSGVSLSLAAEGEADEVDTKAMMALAKRMWPRESVERVAMPRAAEVMALVNACAPLCAMGAGMVSSEYPASVSAAMSFLQHALAATQRLLCEAAALGAGAPLPAGAAATIAMACTSHASREFVFGRRLNFYFKHRDAVRAVYPGASHESLNVTVEGLHTFLAAKGIASPFYEVLMDAFLTVLRASVAGQGLVRSGDYEYRHLSPKDSTLLRHALAVDEAMLSGDENQFEHAKRKLEAAFSADATPVQASSSWASSPSSD